MSHPHVGGGLNELELPLQEASGIKSLFISTVRSFQKKNAREKSRAGFLDSRRALPPPAHTLSHTHPCMAHSDPCCPAIVAATLPSPAAAGAAPAEKRAVHATHGVMMNQTFFLVAQLGIFFSLSLCAQ